MLFLTPRTGPFEKHSPDSSRLASLARVTPSTSCLPTGRTCTPGWREWRSPNDSPRRALALPLPNGPNPKPIGEGLFQATGRRVVSSGDPVPFALSILFMVRHRWIDSTRSMFLVQGHVCTGTEVLFPDLVKFRPFPFPVLLLHGVRRATKQGRTERCQNGSPLIRFRVNVEENAHPLLSARFPYRSPSPRGDHHETRRTCCTA